MVKIISDSTCDLTPDLLSKYDIDILPLHILLGEKEYKDGINITPDQIYSWSDANKTTPKTSAPALSETIELFALMWRKDAISSVSRSLTVCPLPAMLCSLRQKN